jgi:hypothetical protein
VTLKNKKSINPNNLVARNDIKTLTQFYPKEIVNKNNNTFQINDENILNKLRDWFNYRITHFEESVFNNILNLNIRLNRPVKAFRGLLIHGKEKLLSLGWDNLRISEPVQLENTKPVSWSTDPCISLYFTTHDPALHVSYIVNICFGILVSTLLEPEQILLDTRLIASNVKQSLYTRNQHEIISVPSVFDCTIERLYLVNIHKKIYIPVKNFKDSFEII